MWHVTLSCFITCSLVLWSSWTRIILSSLLWCRFVYTKTLSHLLHLTFESGAGVSRTGMPEVYKMSLIHLSFYSVSIWADDKKQSTNYVLSDNFAAIENALPWGQSKHRCFQIWARSLDGLILLVTFLCYVVLNVCIRQCLLPRCLMVLANLLSTVTKPSPYNSQFCINYHSSRILFF